MSLLRVAIIDWCRQGRLASRDLPRAMERAGLYPDTAAWRVFLDRLLLWAGAAFLASAVIYFFAFNWQEMHRLVKLALVQSLLIGAVAVAWYFRLDNERGQAALLAATLLLGATLALFGQSYQTGADTYELFLYWALLALPWVLVGRHPALWLLWIGLSNLALTLYLDAFGGFWWGRLSDQEAMLALFWLNLLALGLWEFAAWRGVSWLRGRWAPRILGTAAGGLITSAQIWGLVDHPLGRLLATVPLMYPLWVAGMYFFYRLRRLDLFMLAGLSLSLILVGTLILGKMLAFRGGAFSFLLLGIFVIGSSAVAGTWLKRLAQEVEE